MNHKQAQHEDFEDLLDEWQDVYRGFFAALDLLPEHLREKPGLCGEWHARQLVAHMAGWHAVALGRFVAIRSGDTQHVTYSAAAIDARNAEHVAARAHLSWAQTVAELRVNMARLYEEVRGLLIRRAAYDPRYGAWLRRLSDDARLHTEQIRAWLLHVD